MAEISINHALEQIRSTRMKDRTDGIADLKHILSQNRRSSKLNELNDKGYHKLFETLFHVIQNEKANYIKSTKATRSLSGSRLSSCASALRLAVEVGTRTIRYKSVKALVDHITQALLSSEEHYFEPLLTDYIKALKALLEYRPHLEHLIKEDWQTLVDFIIQGIQIFISDGEAESSVLTLSNSSNRLVSRLSRSATPSTVGSSLGQFHGSGTRTGSITQGIRIVDDFVTCLYYLLSTSNAPVVEKGPAASAVLLELLSTQSGKGADHATFMCINATLASMITEDVDLARQILRDVVPHIRRLWQSKSQLLREEMLLTMIYGDALLASLAYLDDWDECRNDLQGLYDVFLSEYTKRSEREQLLVDDLDLTLQYKGQNAAATLGASTFSLRVGTQKAGQSWAVLNTMTSMFATLQSPHPTSSSLLDADGTETPRKRRRMTNAVDMLIEPLQSAAPSERLVALQMLAFVIGKTTLDKVDMLKLLEALTPILSSDNPDLATWAMLASSCAARQTSTTDSGQNGVWLQIWQSCARSISSVLVSRAACHLMSVILDMGLVQYQEVADIVDTMLGSVDLNGPAAFTDSSAILWTILINSKAKHNPGSIHDTSERVLHWLFVRWKPSQIHDRQRLAQISKQFQASSILQLISAILHIANSHERHRYSLGLCSISQAVLRCKYSTRLVEYLLLHEGKTAKSFVDHPQFPEGTDTRLPDAKFQGQYNMATEFLIVEISALLKEGPLSEQSDSHGLNTEVACIVGSVCVVAFGLVSAARFPDSGRTRVLRDLATTLRNRLVYVVMRQDNPTAAVDGILGSLEGLLYNPGSSLTEASMLYNGAVETARGFTDEFWSGIRFTDDEVNVKGDLMEVDEDFESQGSIRSRNDITTKQVEHDWLRASTNAAAHRACLIAKVCLISVGGSQPLSENSKAQEFLYCRQFFKALLQSGVGLDDSGGIMLLEYLGQAVLQPYELERCEVAMAACLDIMTGLADLWTDNERESMADLGASLYEWFIKVMTRGICSPHVYQCLALMLQRVIKVQPEYAKGLGLPSARTSLFRILEEGTIAVKFEVGMNISNIFGLFILKEHDAILDDIVNSLPTVRDWTEGIALRLFVLAHLGSSWSTLLRRCTYAIFETAGQVPNSVKHAKYCVNYMSNKLHLSGSQELFKLFVSQIIFTWLETQAINTIPFSIFGYSSLASLLKDVQDEVTGQVVMRGRIEEAQQLVETLSLPYDSLLESSFGKCAAYCIARDATVPPARDIQASGADARLRKLLGKEHYGALISKHFPEILAILYKTTDREENITKGFQKHEGYTKAHEAYDEIMSFGSSTAILPASQQPSFKAGYLIDEIEHLYSRTAYDPEAVWSPALYVFILRELLNSIHAALGSLHACSVIRRIRILVCMAGETALTDYPLEMALHSIRPFLTDTHCSDDAMGIVQYLLRHGLPYLQEAPSFVAGLIVSVLASMKKFLNSPQESTTQESQFRATMSKAQTFQVWLSAFADNYASPHLDDSAEQSFRAVVLSARHLRNVGNARKGTYESDLLLELLKDRRHGSKLIDEASQNLILDLLCRKFEVGASFRDDILGSEKQAAAYVSAVWSTCQNRTCASDYLLWVARVLGRAYGGTGIVELNMSREVQVTNNFVDETSSQQGLESNSRRIILRQLWNIVLADSRQDASLAERTLQRIVTVAEDTEILADFQQVLPGTSMASLTWVPFPCPSIGLSTTQVLSLQEAVALTDDVPYHTWVRQLCIALIDMSPKDKVLRELKTILLVVDGLPEKLFASILHLVLLAEMNKQQTAKQIISTAVENIFKEYTDSRCAHTKILLQAIIYLRGQPLLHETTKAGRCRWLDFDYEHAATAAANCRMFKTALLLLEIGFSEASKTKRSRRSSGLKLVVPTELLLLIFRNLEDKDSFYGIRQPSSLSTMMDQLEYENAGFKSLSFRGAHFDAQLRHLQKPVPSAEEELIKVLDTLDLNGLSQSVLSNMTSASTMSTEAMLRTARKLERWDISSPVSQTSEASTIFRVFQDIHRASDRKTISTALDRGFRTTIGSLLATKTVDSSLHSMLGCLAVLSEIEDIISSEGSEQFHEAWERIEARNEWMFAESLDHVNNIASCRLTLFSTFSKSSNLQDLLKTSQRDARRIECRALVASTRLSRHHGALQNALATATYLGQISQQCLEQGVRVDASARLEGSDVLWDQNEMSASIRMLHDIVRDVDLTSQDMQVGKPEILAKLGHRISEARLEKPDEIITNYLLPAIKELAGVTDGHEAGRVFHEFAAFCDQQLQNPDNLEDFQRIQRLRERKQAEVRDLERMIQDTSSQSKEKDNLESHRKKAQSWFDLDNREYQRLRDGREAFLRQSLENYLLGLKACDNYDNDALRFSALWLEHSDSQTANRAVSKHINQVGSRKFASLMNQWTSRLLDTSNDFQVLLSALVFRICVEHPYHGMYQVFAGSKTKGGKDQSALSRNAAASNIVTKIKANRRAAPIWLSIHNTNINFVRFAQEKLDDSKYKPGARILLKKSPSGVKVEQDVATHKIPPPTARISLRSDCNYSDAPHVVKYQAEFTLASGISMPKIVTAVGSDGRKYKQLFKGGNDDLRQDSIMEQVFEQVSNLLNSQRETRQRHLGIRTYKVLPLTSTSGIIEFVSDTVPLHDYLMPAHQRHFPNDFKPSVCRKYILDVQNKPVDARVKTYLAVCERFHPVLRYFFMERFESPDDWFEKRLAYTRSTAAISILGFILGLGDRHGHNILLDEKTGEVVHIDLGIAFEQGRVLPVPELVPFRLTRDLVDGMGITKTEGVFRRCCEFTLEALRNESYSIMTILDVLRYDPLYSWSLSPLRLKKLQENQTDDKARLKLSDDDFVPNNKPQNEPGEADRALTVVSKKLSKSLSVTATVNELIQQATDEKNLALLFCGWAAYA